MSLKAQLISPIPELTAQVVSAAFRKGNGFMQLRDLLIDLYPADDQSAAEE